MAKHLMPQAPLMYGEDYIYPLTRAEQVVLSDGTRLEKNGVLSVRTSDGGSLDPLAFYPIGSIYLSVNATNPGALFGGVWEQIKDKFMLAAGDTYIAGSTGGAATVTLTEAQMPEHYHTEMLPVSSTDVRPLGVTTKDETYTTSQALTSGGNKYLKEPLNYLSASSDTPVYLARTQDAGSGAAHNNMPPYLTVYMWKRVG